MVAGGGLLAGFLHVLFDLREELVVGRGFVGRHGRSGSVGLGGVGLGSILGGSGGFGGLLGGFGGGDFVVHGLEGFGRAEILGVEGEDRLILGLGGLQVAFVTGLQGLGEELRLTRGGIAVLGDERAGGEGQGEGCPGKLRTVEIFHRWGR